jgi:undecaprenyl-diphosphatase
VLVYFGPRWWRRWQPPGTTRGSFAAGFIGMTVVATACTGVFGLALKVSVERVLLERILRQPHAEVEQLFGNLPLIAAALLTVGVLIIVAGGRQTSGSAPGLTVRRAVLIGTVQALAVPFRGFSRSGATISTALLLGTERDLAEDFSFALAIWLTPPAIALELHRLLRATGFQAITVESVAALVWPGVVGMGVSLLAGLVALWWLSAWLEEGRWRLFGYYCLVFAALVCAGHRLGL